MWWSLKLESVTFHGPLFLSEEDELLEGTLVTVNNLTEN